MPQRWGIGLAVDGDLRFLSHHDTMRTIERTAIRAALPLRYTQGFNPHPILSLPCPRPVGVAARNDLLVIRLEAPPEALDAPELQRCLNRHAPRGMRFGKALPLALKVSPRPRRAEYELPVPPERAELVRQRLGELSRLECWPVERLVSHKPPRKGPMKTRKFDLKPLVANLELDGDMLRWTALPQGDMWGRCSEVLRLAGLDEQTDLASIVRTAVDFGL